MNETNEPKSVMGWVFGVSAALLALPVAVCKGACDARDGGSFSHGRDRVLACVLAHAGKFGDKYGGKILMRVLSGIAIGVGLDFIGISKRHGR